MEINIEERKKHFNNRIDLLQKHNRLCSNTNSENILDHDIDIDNTDIYIKHIEDITFNNLREIINNLLDKKPEIASILEVEFGFSGECLIYIPDDINNLSIMVNIIEEIYEYSVVIFTLYSHKFLESGCYTNIDEIVNATIYIYEKYIENKYIENI